MPKKAEGIKEPKKLIEQEFREFLMRRSVHDQAKCHYVMVEESYKQWLNEIAKKYKLPDQFVVNMQTGELLLSSPVGDNIVNLPTIKA